MPEPTQLEIAAHSVLTVLGVWLGLTVLVQSRTGPSRLFTFLSLMIAAWSAAVLIDRLTADPAVDHAARVAAEITLALAIPAVAHITVAVGSPRRTSRQRLAIALAYIVNLLVAVPAILDPDHPIRLEVPRFELVPVPVEVLYVAWVAVRFGTLFLAALWVMRQLGRVGDDPARAPQLRGLLATLAFATVGGGFRLLPVLGTSDPWIGITLVAAAMLCAAWTIFSTGVFMAAGVASRAFWGTIAAGIVVAVLAVLVVGVDTISRQVLGIDEPLLLVVTLVAAAAASEPLVGWIRHRAARGSPGPLARERMLRLLGRPHLVPQAADAGVGPAVEGLARTLALGRVSVVTAGGAVVASASGGAPAAEAPAGTPSSAASEPTGRPGAMPGGATSIPLVADGERVGDLVIDESEGWPHRDRDAELVTLAARYLAGALRAGRMEDEQLAGLTSLGRERASLDRVAADLDAALASRATSPRGLRVYALGAMRVERDGRAIDRWGGEKAGTRQAQALFAFLFDRGERGVAKDEALELVWPDVDLEHADLAFHRTLRGLRGVLDPAGGGREVIRFRNDRYRLDPDLVEWSDVAAFGAAVDEAGQSEEPAAASRLLARARELYRGEYLDDCPIFGDSAFVEERRASLRALFVDLLTAIGELAEARADRLTASAAYRDALAAAPDGSARAEAGLARLEVAD